MTTTAPWAETGPATCRAALRAAFLPVLRARIEDGEPKNDFDAGYRAALAEVAAEVAAAVNGADPTRVVRRPARPYTGHALEWDGTNVERIRELLDTWLPPAHGYELEVELMPLGHGAPPVPVLCVYTGGPDPVDELPPGWVVVVFSDGTVDMLHGDDFDAEFTTA